MKRRAQRRNGNASRKPEAEVTTKKMVKKKMEVATKKNRQQKVVEKIFEKLSKIKNSVKQLKLPHR